MRRCEWDAGTSPPQAQRQAILLMALFGGLWAVIEMLGAWRLQRYSPYQVVWTRYVTHLLLMVAVWGWRSPGSLWKTRHVGLQLSRSLLMLIMPVAWIMALQRGLASDTVLAVFWVAPLLVVLLARYILDERVPVALWVASFAACVGAWLLDAPSRPASLSWLLLLPACAAAAFSLYVVMTRSLRVEPSRVNLFHTAFWVALALTPFMPAVWLAPSWIDWLVMAGIGILGYVALWSLDRMAAGAPVAPCAPASCLQPVFAAGISALLVGGHGGAAAVVGAATIVAAVWYVWARTAAPVPGTVA